MSIHNIKHSLIILIIGLTAVACACINCGKKESLENETTITVSVPTIQCSKCKKNIEKALAKVDGIGKPVVDVSVKKLTVSFDSAKTNQELIERAVTLAGYQANDKPADKDAYDKLDDCCKIGGHN